MSLMAATIMCYESRLHYYDHNSLAVCRKYACNLVSLHQFLYVVPKHYSIVINMYSGRLCLITVVT